MADSKEITYRFKEYKGLFKPQMERFSSFDSIADLPRLSYYLYPIRKKSRRSFIVQGVVYYYSTGGRLHPYPDFVQDFLKEVRELSRSKNIIFEGSLVMPLTFNNFIQQKYTNPDSIRFYCYDAIVNGDINMKYYDRISFIPDIFPRFQKENFYFISSRATKYVYILFSIYSKDNIVRNHYDGIIFRRHDAISPHGRIDRNTEYSVYRKLFG